MTLSCYVCKGDNNVTEVTDGRDRHLVCDDCRDFVTALFYVHGSIKTAVREAAQAKRGSREE